MRKHYNNKLDFIKRVRFIISFMIIFAAAVITGCAVNSDETPVSHDAVTDEELLYIAENLRITEEPAAILPPADGTLYVKIGDTLFYLPENWRYKIYASDDIPNGFSIYHKATYDINSDAGLLFTARKCEGIVPDEYITENPGGTTYLQADDYYIAFTIPTDVQYLPGNQTADEYLEFAGQIPDIQKSVVLSVKE